MVSQRFYASHRRAWTPRFWPIAVLASGIVVPTLLVFDLTPLAAIPLSFAVGVAVALGRFEIWKRRHPVITPAEYLDDIRSKAHLN